jgi:hypothetical protein
MVQSIEDGRSRFESLVMGVKKGSERKNMGEWSVRLLGGVVGV